jgi:glutaredoxin-like YruB-family protein
LKSARPNGSYYEIISLQTLDAGGKLLMYQPEQYIYDELPPQAGGGPVEACPCAEDTARQTFNVRVIRKEGDFMARLMVYSQPTCPACNELKEHLKKKGVDFEDRDITTDHKAMQEMLKVHKVRVTPLLILGDKKIIGYDPVEIDKLLSENDTTPLK